MLCFCIAVLSRPHCISENRFQRCTNVHYLYLKQNRLLFVSLCILGPPFRMALFYLKLTLTDSLLHGVWIMFAARRGLPRNVYDGGPEEVLRRHEEDGEEETCESHPETSGKIFFIIILVEGYCERWKSFRRLCWGATCVCAPPSFLPPSPR